jgi:hypothetical protein
MFPFSKRAGTDTSVGWSSVFPAFPSGASEREHEINSVYAAVPAVPAVPIETPLIGDPKSWEAELHQWTAAHCVFRDRAWGGLAALHTDYVEWSHATGNIPPATLETFRIWAVWQGFTLAGSLIHGLILTADVNDLINAKDICGHGAQAN